MIITFQQRQLPSSTFASSAPPSEPSLPVVIDNPCLPSSDSVECLQACYETPQMEGCPRDKCWMFDPACPSPAPGGGDGNDISSSTSSSFSSTTSPDCCTTTNPAEPPKVPEKPSTGSDPTSEPLRPGGITSPSPAGPSTTFSSTAAPRPSITSFSPVVVTSGTHTITTSTAVVIQAPASVGGSSSSSNLPAIIGGAVGGAVGLALVGAAIYLIKKFTAPKAKVFKPDLVEENKIDYPPPTPFGAYAGAAGGAAAGAGAGAAASAGAGASGSGGGGGGGNGGAQADISQHGSNYGWQMSQSGAEQAYQSQPTGAEGQQFQPGQYGYDQYGNPLDQYGNPCDQYGNPLNQGSSAQAGQGPNFSEGFQDGVQNGVQDALQDEVQDRLRHRLQNKVNQDRLSSGVSTARYDNNYQAAPPSYTASSSTSGQW